MPKAVTALSVFLSSPSDAKTERESAREIIKSADEDFWDSRGICLRVLRWEDAPGGLGDPQGIINEYAEDADLVVVIFNERFGSATANYSSATLEEFERARAKWKSRGRPQVKIFFKQPTARVLKKPSEQLKQVLCFKERFWQERIGLYTEYKTQDDFNAKFRREFSKWLDQVTLRKDDSAPGRARGGLPEPVRPFVIRDADVQTVRSLLRQEEVAAVTLHGVPGNGKSSLAVHAAAGLKAEYGNRLVYVNLSAACDGQDIIRAIADKLGVRSVRDVDLVQSVRENLRDERTLLLLDDLNAVDAAGPQLALLSGAPGLKMLIAAPRALGLEREEGFKVRQLTFPSRKDLKRLTAVEAPEQYSAIKLFYELKRLKEPNFKLTDANVSAVAEICERLDGLPHPIKVVAESIGSLALEQKSTQIRKLLQRGMDGLEAALRSSYDTLRPAVKATFRRLSVFTDGFTPDGAVYVCDGVTDDYGEAGPTVVIDAIESLVGKGLLEPREQAWGETRLMMLNTVREFAQRHLGEDETAEERLKLWRRYAAFYLDLAENVEPLLTSGDREAKSWQERLEADTENLNSVLDWSQTEEGDGLLGLKLSAALFWFWNLRGSFEEGRERINTAQRKAAESADGCTLAKAFYCLGGLHFLLSEYETAEDWLRKSVELWRAFPERKRELGLALVVLGMTLLQQEESKHADARECEEAGVRIFRESGDDWGLALALSDLGNVEKEAGNYAEAQKCYEESLATWVFVKDSWGRSLALSYLGDLAYRDKRPLAARRNLREALDIQRARGDKWGMAWSLNMLGRIDASEPDYEQAAEHFRESLSLHVELGRKHMIAYCLEGLVGVACKEGEWRRAVVLAGAAKALRKSSKAAMTPAEEAAHRCYLEQINEKLGAATVGDALAQGEKMSLDLEALVSYATAGSS